MASFSKPGVTQLLLDLAADASLSKSPNRRKRRSFLLEEEPDHYSGIKSRIETFSTAFWTLKPVEVSPVYCARYGWVCLEKDLLQCVSCKSYLSGHLPSPSDLESYKKCVDRLRKAVVDSHTTSCQWKSSPNSISDFSPDILDRDTAINNIKENLRELGKSSCDLKALSLVPSSQLGLTDEDLTMLMRTCECDDLAQLLLVCCGWTGGTDVRNTVVCRYCLRTLGLWLFNNEESSQYSVVGTKKSRLEQKKRELNPVQQHHPWCPWVNPPENTSVVHSSSEPTEVPSRWISVLRLILKPEQITVSTEENAPKRDSAATEYFVLAKQLMEETIARVEMAEAAEKESS